MLNWWRRRIEIPVVLFLMLVLGTGAAIVLLLQPAPRPIIQTIREVLNPTATYVPPNPNLTNLTYISSLASATPAIETLAPVHQMDITALPCPAVVSDSGGKFVFRLWLQRSKELYRANADGSGLCFLTRDNYVDDQPSWSPDGQQIAFVSTREGYGIYIMDADGSNKTKLTDGGTAYSFPAWSPDGNQIVFQATIDERFDLYQINTDGTGLRNLTNQPRLDTVPDWSRDGRWIAFASDRTFNPFIKNRLAQGANYEIYLMDKDGLNVHRLTSNDVFDFDPAWSPDGQRVAFTSGYYNIFVMNYDGSGSSFLTSGHAPVWSTDGRTLAFINAGRLALIDLSTGEIKQIEDLSEIEYMDYWSGP